jgi:hypothetical protein
LNRAAPLRKLDCRDAFHLLQFGRRVRSTRGDADQEVSLVMPGNVLRQWLSAKTQSFLGVSRLQAQLAQIQEQLQAALAAKETRQAAAESLRSPDLQALQSLDKQGLFILGCARSGTTILTRSLNRSRDVLVLEEANLYLLHGVTDFVSYFNAHHTAMGNRCLKGTYLPPPLTLEDSPIAALLRLADSYRLVGEKVALSPHESPPNWQQTYLDFQGKYFFHAKYLHILRTPVEAVWSMHKMFPDRPISRLFQTWLESIALSLDAYHVFPNSKVLFFDDLGQQLTERLSSWLELPIPSVPGTFGRQYIYSALSPERIPEPLLPFADLCQECTAIYRDLRESFSSEEFVYCGSTTEWAYFDTKLRHMQKMIEGLAQSEPACSPRLRIAS